MTSHARGAPPGHPDHDIPSPPPEWQGAPLAEEREHALRWERIAGLVLVIGLVGFTLIQYWGQQSSADHYRAGSRAAAALDWDRARAEFAAANGYGDAAARLADAQNNITTRDRQYSLLTAAVGRADWVAALQALQPLQPLAPHYRNVEALATQALSGATTMALTDVVALRLDATPPGLYRFGAAGWRALAGSNAASRVRAFCPDGGVLYDVPASAASTDPPISSTPGRQLSAHSAAGVPRPLRLDRPDGSAPIVLAGDPDPRAQYICTARGVWTVRASGALGSGLGGAQVALDVAYQTFADGHRVTPDLPGPNWYVVGVAPQSATLLLLDGTDVQPPDWRARLYTANPDGSARRLLLEVSGQLEWAMFSPDGRYVALSLSSTPGPGPGVVYSVFLLDTSGQGTPTTLATIASPGDLGPDGLFLQQPPRTNQLLLSWFAGNRQLIRLFDPAHPASPLVETALAEAGTGWNAMAVDPAQGNLLLLVTAPSPAPGAAGGTLMAITPENAIKRFTLGAVNDGGIWVRASELLSLGIANTTGNPARFALHSQPLPTADTPHPSAREIFNAPQRIAGDPTVPFLLAPNWLVYSAADGVLHGRSYDGTLDVPLHLTATAFPMSALWEAP